MFCRCLGVKEEEKCHCESRSLFAYRVREDGDGCSPFYPRARVKSKKRQTSMVTTIVEKVYDKCAGYNLRHCHFRGFVNNKNYLTNTLKDLAILSCFLLANFVVFMAIFTRMSVQMTFCIMETIKWIRRLVKHKQKPTTSRPDFSNIINPSRAPDNSIIGLRNEFNKLYEAN